MNEMYVIVVDFWLDGVMRRAGEKVAMSDAKAKYLLLSGTIRKEVGEPMSEVPVVEPMSEEDMKALAKKK